MRESMGNALIFGIVIFFVFLMMFILTAATNYSRANKIKNKILNYVSNYAELKSTTDGESIEPIDLNDGELEKEIERELSEIGYRMNNGGIGRNVCPQRRGVTAINPNSNYHYCLYAFYSKRGYYYGVTTFMYFDIPIIGTTLEFPVYGETSVIYDLGGK